MYHPQETAANMLISDTQLLLQAQLSLDSRVRNIIALQIRRSAEGIVLGVSGYWTRTLKKRVSRRSLNVVARTPLHTLST